jgi:hypothetical protein
VPTPIRPHAITLIVTSTPRTAFYAFATGVPTTSSARVIDVLLASIPRRTAAGLAAQSATGFFVGGERSVVPVFCGSRVGVRRHVDNGRHDWGWFWRFVCLRIHPRRDLVFLWVTVVETAGHLWRRRGLRHGLRLSATGFGLVYFAGAAPSTSFYHLRLVGRLVVCCRLFFDP